ncbi:hypothetical protein LKE08_19760 [Lyngbya sp. CCY1209]|nr:hypothetical protein [Lyngbya sp. CCY1209]
MTFYKGGRTTGATAATAAAGAPRSKKDIGRDGKNTFFIGWSHVNYIPGKAIGGEEIEIAAVATVTADSNLVETRQAECPTVATVETILAVTGVDAAPSAVAASVGTVAADRLVIAEHDVFEGDFAAIDE